MLGDLKGTVLAASREVPLLGICLGMQMLMDSSEEHGIHRGLALVPGEVKRFPVVPGMKVPHMGWNTIRIEAADPLFEGVKSESYVYFVHSFYASTTPAYMLTSTEYIRPFASSIRSGTTYGVQFHPEKSGAVGLRLLRELHRARSVRAADHILFSRKKELFLVVRASLQFPLPEDVPLDLAGEGLWQFRHELDRPGILVRGGRATHVPLQLLHQRLGGLESRV